MDWISDPQSWIALGTLTALEIVLGIDNIVVISILTAKLPESQQKRARFIGLALAMGARVALLFSIAWMMQLTAPIFTVLGEEISGRDLILLVGGAFLIYKSTHEIHNKLEGEAETHGKGGKVASFGSVIFQILLLDLVFSLDSVITAIGMAEEISVMVIAIIIAIIIMMVSVGTISNFILQHPTVKMLALSFLLLIGVMLIAEGMDQHIPKGYIYSAMGFSLIVEMLNLRVQRKRPHHPVDLHFPRIEEAERKVAGSQGPS